MSLVHTDARGRLSLGKQIQPDRDYRVTNGPHGTVVLEPITAITDYERAVLSNPELVARLDAANEQIARGETTPARRRERRAA